MGNASHSWHHGDSARLKSNCTSSNIPQVAAANRGGNHAPRMELRQYRRTVGFPQHRHKLFVGKSALSHRFLAIQGAHSPETNGPGDRSGRPHRQSGDQWLRGHTDVQTRAKAPGACGDFAPASGACSGVGRNRRLACAGVSMPSLFACASDLLPKKVGVQPWNPSPRRQTVAGGGKSYSTCIVRWDRNKCLK